MLECDPYPTTQENNGEKPDFQVELTPEDWLANRDPQLDKAIDLLSPGPASVAGE